MLIHEPCVGQVDDARVLDEAARHDEEVVALHCVRCPRTRVGPRARPTLELAREHAA